MSPILHVRHNVSNTLRWFHVINSLLYSTSAILFDCSSHGFFQHLPASPSPSPNLGALWLIPAQPANAPTDIYHKANFYVRRFWARRHEQKFPVDHDATLPFCIASYYLLSAWRQSGRRVKCSQTRRFGRLAPTQWFKQRTVYMYFTPFWSRLQIQ